MPAQFHALLDPEWRKREPNRYAHAGAAGPPRPAWPNWSYEVTPVMPGRCYYAYAIGFDPDISDGQRIGTLWARVTLDRERAPQLELLADEVRQIGVQGVRPLRPAEAADFQLRYAAEAELMANKFTQVVHSFYRIWSQGNGVIVKEIRPRHEPFFAWLERSDG